jgi:uncharacterized membrane protein YdbT with pleckstrin-like domain
MSAMNALKKLLLTVGASGAVLALAVGPVVADDAPADDATAEAEEGADAEGEDAEADDAEGEDAEVDDAEAEVVDEEGDDADDNGKIALAETPRDRIGLIMIAALLAAGFFAATNARRQLKGERPQATGEFRWR